MAINVWIQKLENKGYLISIMRKGQNSFTDISNDAHDLYLSTDVAINQRPSVFEKILQPTTSAPPCSTSVDAHLPDMSGLGASDCLQMELHIRTAATGTCFMVLLNNMQLLCNADWILHVQEFLANKPENPFLAGNFS